MPTSQHYQLTSIMDLIISINPGKVLDIGVGFGKYGVLCREYLELWDGREDYFKFLRKIDGIEAFEKYLSPLHKYVYDNIFIGDALDLIGKLETNYDIVLLIDVLEHFNKEDGKYLLDKILSKNSGILISVPKDIGDQKDAFSNPYEEHKAQWTMDDFSDYKNSYIINNSFSLIIYIGDPRIIEMYKKNVSELKKQNKKSKLKSLIPGPLLIPYRFLKRIFR